jgi:hypothetical protein
MSTVDDPTPSSGTPEDERLDEPDFSVRLLRSFTPLSGALLGVSAAAGYLLGAAAYALPFGQPTPDPVANLASALALLGTLGGAFGALLGLVVWGLVRLKATAGPADWRLVKKVLALVFVAFAALGIQTAWSFESANWVRVVQTSPAIARIDGPSSLAPKRAAVLVYELFGKEPTHTLMWHNHPVTVSQTEQIVTIHRGVDVVDVVNMRRMDYLTEIVATTATLDGTREWLAVLVRIVSTARRDLLLVYDSEGSLVHKEVFERMTPDAGTALWSAGANGSTQEIMVDVGSPVRFAAGR